MPKQLFSMGFLGGTSGKEPACQCRRHKRGRFDPWVGTSPGGGHGNPLQYSSLENPMDRGAWWATVHRVAKSWIQLKWLSTALFFSISCLPSWYSAFWAGHRAGLIKYMALLPHEHSRQKKSILAFFPSRTSWGFPSIILQTAVFPI